MAATLTTLDKLLKIVYIPGLANWVNTKRPLYGRIEKITDKKRFSGREMLLAAKEVNPQGVGAIAESEVLPTGGNTTIQNPKVNVRYHYGVARLSAQAMQAAGTDAGGFADAVKVELTSLRDQFEEVLAIHSIFGDGYGAIGEIASVSTNDLTLKTQPTVGAIGTRLIRKGQYLSSYTAKTGGSSGMGVSALVTADTITSTVVTVSDGTSATAGDFLFRQVNTSTDPRNKVTYGLGAIVDDGTRRSSFQNITRSSVPAFKANKLSNSGVLRAWTPELMDEVAQESKLNGGGNDPTAFYSPLEIQRRAAAYIRADRTFDMSVKEYDGGYKGMSWSFPGGEAPWFTDRYCIPNEIHAVHEPDLFLAIQEDTQFEERDGAMWRFTDRKHELEAWLYTWRTLGARACNSHSYLQDISHTA